MLLHWIFNVIEHGVYHIVQMIKTKIIWKRDDNAPVLREYLDEWGGTSDSNKKVGHYSD